MRKPGFQSLFLVLLMALSFGTLNLSAQSPIEGRWDMSIHENGKEYPSWLEVVHSGSKRFVGSYVGITGSARPVSSVLFNDNKISFSLPPQWEEENNDLKFEGNFKGDSLAGTMTAANGKTYQWTARKAPLLRKEKEPGWGTPVQLIGDNNMDQWIALGNNQWTVNNGIMKSDKSGANLITKEKYNDFKLHVEFRCPKGSNSGVYLRGRYEVQIEDDYGREPEKHLLGAIYGFLTPTEMAAKQAGEWQTYDITLVGRNVNIVANGKNIICNQDIPGITGGALDSHEELPGPIMIQGDHGPIEYRNIIITPAK